MTLMALDISTSRTGWCIFDDSKKLIKIGFIDLTKIDKNPYKKLDVACAEVDKIVKMYNVTDAIAEAALQKFTAGKSSAATMNLLISFNFALSYHIRNLGVNICHVSFAEARKKTGIKFVKKSSSAEKKELIRQYCERKYPFIKWEYKKTGKVKDWCHDVSDAIIIGETVI